MLLLRSILSPDVLTVVAMSGLDTSSSRSGSVSALLPQVLVEKARVEAEDAQRILLSALNGLAGLMLIDDDKPQAVALYRQVPFFCSIPFPAWGTRYAPLHPVSA